MLEGRKHMLRVLAATLLWLCSSGPAAARDNPMVVRWSDLAPHVNGMKISTVLTDGSRIEGRAVSVESEALVVTVTKTSNRAAYAPGRALLPRTSLSTIRVGHTGWKWKVIGPIVGFVGMGAVGAAIGN